MPTDAPQIRFRRSIGSAALLVLLVVWPAAIFTPADHACRFWALVGSDYPSELISDQLSTGRVANLRDLGGANRDGWGIGYFLPPGIEDGPLLPILRRGGPPANHPTDPDFDMAVSELASVRPRAAIGHVRAGTSGHWGIPNPHPFQHEGILFGHNGSVPEDLLEEWLTDDDPSYLQKHPPDYVNGHIDSELYFLYLLQYAHAHPKLRRAEALRQAVRNLAEVVNGRLNFVATAGETLFALRYGPYDSSDPLRYSPGTQPPDRSPYWVVASEIVGSDPRNWGTIPPKSLAIFVPGESPTFLSIEEEPLPEEQPGPVGHAQPNPLRESIEIPIRAVESASDPQIAIFDIQGRLIWEQTESRRPSGERVMRWNGRDRNGALVPSGTYFCRVTVGGQSRTQTISVLR